MRALASALQRFDREGERWLLLVLYGFIVAVIFLEVIRRFVLAYSSIWGEETARYAFVYLVWIGAAAGVRDRAHIRIDILAEALPPRAKALLYMAGEVVTLVFALFALRWSIEPVIVSLTFGSVTDGLRIVKAWFLVAVPLGFTLVVVRVVQSLVRDFADFRAGRPVFTGNRLFE